MARVAREKSQSRIYHVMLRGINRQAIFEDDADREKFLETLKSFKKISRYKIYAYCLMENHVHLLIEETQTCPCVFPGQTVPDSLTRLKKQLEL